MSWVSVYIIKEININLLKLYLNFGKDVIYYDIFENGLVYNTTKPH